MSVFPFDNSKCPKCGATVMGDAERHYVTRYSTSPAVEVRYVPPVRWWQFWKKDRRERMRGYCYVCRASWIMETKDQTEQVEKAMKETGHGQ